MYSEIASAQQKQKVLTGDPQVRHSSSDSSTWSFTTSASKEMEFSLQNWETSTN